MLGLACGDALGRPVEFRTPREIEAEYGTLTDMVGDGTWGQPVGTITDDTEQALCIARSLVEESCFNPSDIADRFVEWYDSNPFDIGNMTRRSIRELKKGVPWDESGRRVWESSQEGSNAGNGSVMRSPPIALAYLEDREKLARISRETSLITHADPRCTFGSAVLNLTIAGLLHSDTEPLEAALDYVGPDAPDELVAALEPIARGDEVESLPTSGYVVHSLQTALHDGLRATDTEEAVITAVNRGGDTDTIGAIAGAVAGAQFGMAGLPEGWLSVLDERSELAELAVGLRDAGID